MEELYDVIIVGSGPAGLTAAIYTTRADLKTLVIAGLAWGGQLMLTTDVENFPGFPDGIKGPQLMMNMRKQAEKFGSQIVDANMDPVDFTQQKSPFTVTANGKTYKGKVVLIATGENSKMLDVPGEKEFGGRGVSYCATCDGAFFRNKEIIVVGGGDSAMEEANFLTTFASKVRLIHRRDEFKASAVMIERVKKNPKIEIVLNSQITEISGTNSVEKVKLKNTKTGEESELPIQGVFVAIGHTPNSAVFPGLELKEGGYIRAQQGTHTNVEGIFVSGDIEDDRYRQAVTAAGFGCEAALDIEKYLREHAS